MADRGGFIVLHRKILDSWVWKLENNDHTKVALQLLLEANWKPTKIMRGGEMIEIPRGSCLVAERKLAKRAGVGRQVCRTAIRLLVTGGFLTRDLTHGFSLITIVNYDTYQDRSDEANPAANPPLTHDQPTANPRLTRSEQGNKETTEGAGQKRKPKTHPDRRRVMDLWTALYRNAYGEPPAWSGKERTLANTLAGRGFETVERKARILFEDPPDWLKPPYTIGTLSSNWDRLVKTGDGQQDLLRALRGGRP
jgi:hypothetical protein